MPHRALSEPWKNSEQSCAKLGARTIHLSTHIGLQYPTTFNQTTLVRLQTLNARAISSCSSQNVRPCINIQIRPQTIPSRSRFRHPWRWGLRQRNVRLSSLGPLQVIHVDVSKHTTFDCYLANSYFATRMSGGRLYPPRRRCSESFARQIRTRESGIGKNTAISV